MHMIFSQPKLLNFLIINRVAKSCNINIPAMSSLFLESFLYKTNLLMQFHGQCFTFENLSDHYQNIVLFCTMILNILCDI